MTTYNAHVTPDEWSTAALLRDYAYDALAVQFWDRWGWRTLWAREGVEIVGDRYDDSWERAENLARGIHLHYAAGYSPGDVIRTAHNGDLSRETVELIRSLVFDGVDYAIREYLQNGD